MTQYSAFVTRGKQPIAKVTGVSARDLAQAGDRAIARVRRDFGFSKEIQLFATSIKPAAVGSSYQPEVVVLDMRIPNILGTGQLNQGAAILNR